MERANAPLRISHIENIKFKNSPIGIDINEIKCVFLYKYILLMVKRMEEELDMGKIDEEFGAKEAEEEIDLSKIPRRKRRFFRNNKILLKALSKHIQKTPDVKEIEKRKIIEKLRWQLSMIEKKELLNLADVLFEQLNDKEAASIVRANIRAKKAVRPELSEEDCKEIVENIYEQLREAAEEERRLKHKEKKKKKEVEKIKKTLKRAIRTTSGAKREKRNIGKRKREEIKPKKPAVKEPAGEELPADSEDILSMLKEESAGPGEAMLETEIGGGSEDAELDVFKELEELTEEKPKKKSNKT